MAGGRLFVGQPLALAVDGGFAGRNVAVSQVDRVELVRSNGQGIAEDIAF